MRNIASSSPARSEARQWSSPRREFRGFGGSCWLPRRSVDHVGTQTQPRNFHQHKPPCPRPAHTALVSPTRGIAILGGLALPAARSPGRLILILGRKSSRESSQCMTDMMCNSSAYRSGSRELHHREDEERRDLDAFRPPHVQHGRTDEDRRDRICSTPAPACPGTPPRQRT